jgi:hypothetical protein
MNIRYVINSEAMKKMYKTMKRRAEALSEPPYLTQEWHSDSKYPAFMLASGNTFLNVLGLFENCPSDFSFLRMQDTPPTGGDTLWCSGYEL